MFQELIDNVTNIDILTDSVKDYVSNLSINSVIMTIMMIFMIVGAIDKMRGNKKGYGAAFDEGFDAMGDLAKAMVGVVAMAPVLRIILQPIIAPVYELLGASPAMFATTLLANDMGGYPLAVQLAGSDASVGNFAGLILGSMMGPTIVFTIPVALSIIAKKDRPYLSGGVLVGIITIPIGCLVGGLLMNITPYKMDVLKIVQNLIPVIIIAALIAIGLWFKPTKMMNGFSHFGNGLTILITAGTAIAVFQYLTGIHLPLFNIMVIPDPVTGSVPLVDGLMIIGDIAIVLIGAFPMVEWIKKAFKKPLMAFGKALKINEVASTGLIATLANNIAMFNIMDGMDGKGKLLNVTFAVSAAFVFGDHLGFTAGAEKDMIFPVIAGKLIAGITALILANLLAGKLMPKINEDAVRLEMEEKLNGTTE